MELSINLPTRKKGRSSRHGGKLFVGLLHPGGGDAGQVATLQNGTAALGETEDGGVRLRF